MLVEISLTFAASPFEIPVLAFLGQYGLHAADLELLPATADAGLVAPDLLAVHTHVFVNASHAARCTARHGVRSHADPADEVRLSLQFDPANQAGVAAA